MRVRIAKAICQAIHLAFFEIALLSICMAQTTSQADSMSQVIEIRIDPRSAMGGVADELFDSIRYVPLETNKQSQLSDITQLEVTKDYYIILDRSLKTIFFFRHDGSYSHKIDKSEGNKPFTTIERFTVDPSRNILSFDDRVSPYTYTFGLDGIFVNSHKRKDSYRDFVLFKGFKLYYLPEIPAHESGKVPFAAISRYDTLSGELLGSYIPVDSVRWNRALPGASPNFYRSGEEQLLFSQPYDYTIYTFDSVAVPHQRYRIVLPMANTLPDDFLRNPDFHGKWSDILQGNRNQIRILSDVYLSGNFLTFYPFPSIKGSAYLYNLQTNDLFNLTETVDVSLGLPVAERGNPVLATHNGVFISGQSFLSLKQLYQNLPRDTRDEMFPEKLRLLMKKGTSNPILKLLYLKK